MTLEGKHALVTGAGQGIGRAIALKLASLGAAVAVVDLNGEAASGVAREIEENGGAASSYTLDVADPDAVGTAFERVCDELGGIDILVNNAGVTRDGLIMRMSQADWDLVLAVNLTGAFNCIRAASRRMMSQRYGRIVNIASVVGRIGNAGQANYASSKAGIIALTKSVARELGKRGVTANAIAPGYIETAMTGSLSEKARDEFASRIALGRFGRPEDVANVVAFLASDEADYVTGQTINVMADVAEKVKQVIAEKLQIDQGQVTMEASIVEDLGADSLEQADILFSLEDEFGITADDTDEAEGLKTVADIVAYLEKKVAAGS